MIQSPEGAAGIGPLPMCGGATEGSEPAKRIAVCGMPATGRAPRDTSASPIESGPDAGVAHRRGSRLDAGRCLGLRAMMNYAHEFFFLSRGYKANFRSRAV